MQCGPSNNVQRSVEIPLPAGAAYMLSKRAQGRTFWCTRHKVRRAWATNASAPRVQCASWHAGPSFPQLLHGGGLTGAADAPCRVVQVAHESCTCCWMHGVWNPSERTRQSITMRAYDEEWGRPSSPEEEEEEEAQLVTPLRRGRRS
jgi:hypothetical protein